ncbi:MAG: immunoglobulin domain-containing protein, partial [Limisphaerales bacterium]
MSLALVNEPGDRTATNGDRVELSVTAQGSPPIDYQWYFNETNALAAGTSNTLVLEGVTVEQAGSYQVVVSNPYDTVTSAPAQLTVVVPATILSGPTNQLATNGDTVFLTVAAQGTAPLSYQWYFNETNLLDNATDSTLILSNVTPAQAGTYGVVVSNGYGTASSAGTLTVIVLPTIACVDRTVELGTAWEFDVPTVTGSNTTLTLLGTTTNQACGQTYTAARSWVVTDGAGYQANCSQTVQVVDTTPPVMSCAGDKSAVLGQAWNFDEPGARDSGVAEALVYDNWTNDMSSAFVSGNVEVGNQVTLAGTERFASRFGLGYWASNTVQSGFEGNVQARVRFYSNDGPVAGGVASPGTVLYDSGGINLTPTNNGSVVLVDFQSGGTVVPLTDALPDTFTWTVEFSGLTGNDTAGLNLFGPPVLGQVRGDYWTNSTQGWMLATNDVASSFAAQLTAVNSGATVTVLSTVTNSTCGDGFTAARAWQAVDACGNASTCTQIVTVVDQSAPVLSSQPQDTTVPTGQTATFTMQVKACPPLAYQWYFNETNVVPEGTDASLVLNNVSDAQAGSYQVVVTNAYGSVTSAPAQLTVVMSLAILNDPTNQVVNNGDTASFIVTAQGAPPLSYQWYFNQTTELPGATDAALTLPEVSLAQAGAYQVVVSNPFGSITSAPAQLTVILAAQILNGPTDQTATNGDNIAFAVTAQGTPPLTYQWFFNQSNSLPQGTDATLSLSNVSSNDVGSYEVVVSNPYGSVTSPPAALSVVFKASILTGPSSQTATNGDAVSFSVLADGTPPLAYQWYFNQTQQLSGATSSTLTIDPVGPSQAGSYVVVVSNPYASVTSAPAVLTVDASPSIVLGPTNQTVPAGATAVFAVTAEGTDPLAYQWFFNATNALAGETNSLLSLAAVTNENSGLYSVAVSNVFGSAVSQSATLRVLV